MAFDRQLKERQLGQTETSQHKCNPAATAGPNSALQRRNIRFEECNLQLDDTILISIDSSMRALLAITQMDRESVKTEHIRISAPQSTVVTNTLRATVRVITRRGRESGEPEPIRVRSQVRAYSVSGRGEGAQPNLISPVDNRYKHPTCNSTGNNSEGQ